MARKRNTDMNPGSVSIKLLGHEYEIAFTLEAVDEICDAFGIKVNEIVNILKESEAPDFRAKVIKMLVILINAAARLHNEENPDDQWDETTETALRRRLTNLNFAAVFDGLVDAYVRGFISDAGKQDEDDIGEDPNPDRAT